VLDAVHHLVGLQAQNPLDPYTALWSRLVDFDPHDLGRAVTERRAVRIVVLRGTIHLVVADDVARIRPLCQPVLDGEMARHSQHKDALLDLDLTGVVAFGRELLAEPRTGPQIRTALAARFPHLDAPALAFALRNRIALVQVPPRGVWGSKGQVTLATAESWLGRAVDGPASIDDLVLRYLAAFGPATVADAAAWTRFTGMRDVFERLRPRLLSLRDDRGRELFDLPDAPRPDPDTPAPARFLPEYDNCLLSHADRSRFRGPTGADPLPWPDHPPRGTVLHDGVVAATWTLAAGDLVLHRRTDLDDATNQEIDAEGARLATFLRTS
jgi:hypothetical protein